ncbi:MAG: type II toxin-antitoxin system HicA family toxin [Thaumarchaeota archaeon]|nr:type II toxin-antitoxin system HicA family toxin [Nitrososphaerota archaeon]
MSLPVTSGGKLVRFLVKQGFVIKRKKGSHVILKHSDKRITSVLPDGE